MHNSGTLIIEGLMIHMAMSMMLGIAIALMVWLAPVFGRSSAYGVIAFSVGFSLSVGVLNEYVFWPAIDKGATSMLRLMTFLLGYLLFGAMIGITISKTSQRKAAMVSA